MNGRTYASSLVIRSDFSGKPAEIASIRHFTRLRKLSASSGGQLLHALLENLSHLKQLEVLQLSSVTDSDVKYLKPLSQLRSLSLRFSKITDGGIAQLSSLPWIESLDIGYTDVSDHGLEIISRSYGLRHLVLPTGITDNGLRCIADLPRLELLELNRGFGTNKLTGACLDIIAKLPNLRSLSLSGRLTTNGVDLEDDDLAKLRPVTTLRSLDLSKLGIGDNGVRQIARLRHIRMLNLNSNDDITDAGLSVLGGMKSLERISKPS